MNERAHTGEQNAFCEEPQRMSNRDFAQLSGFISDHCGIKMPDVKKAMLEARLQKRLRALRMRSFRDYCDLLFRSQNGALEITNLIDAVTTNKTDFFREPLHFEFLLKTVLPEFVGSRDTTPGHPYNVWSAGCSTGEEAYTLAMTLAEFAGLNPGFFFSILATDISTKVLERARCGVYDQKTTAVVPESFFRKYFMRSKDRSREIVRVVPELRSAVQYRQMNLMDERPNIPEEHMDAIFCRNVIIYFDRAAQHALLQKLCGSLKTGGYLFLGHSETVYGFDLPLVRIASTIYRKVPHP